MCAVLSMEPKPFVKWAGGKRQIVKILTLHMPKNYKTYIEPFLGGGALFFEVMPKKAIACNMANAEDFVYLDPPYYPYKGLSSFTKYTKYDFTEKDHKRLRDVFVELDKKGVYVMLTNSNTDFIKSLYKGYRIQVLYTTRAINCRGELRGKSSYELLITNY